MKSLSLFNRPAKPSANRILALSTSIAIIVLAGAMPARAGHLLFDITGRDVNNAIVTTVWPGGFVNPTGKFNLKNNNLIFRQDTGVTLANATSLLYAGEYGPGGPNGYWDGFGINSGNAANDPNQQSTIGYVDNTQIGFSSFNTVNGNFGYDVSSFLDPARNDIIIKTTWYGDANLDTVVTLDDYAQWSTAFVATPNGPGSWLDGDFNADGSITLDDLGLWESAFIFTSGGTVPYALTSGEPPKGGTVVPEPGSLGLLALGVAGLLGKRRKRTFEVPSNC